MTTAALHVLLALVDGPLHGYGIKRDVENRSEGAIRLGPGTLYEAIHRLAVSGWIEPAGQEGRKKNYRLTREGRRQLTLELRRLEGIVHDSRAQGLLSRAR